MVKNNGNMPIHGETVRAGDAMRTTGGLTKREYFAGLAMQGVLASDTDFVMDKHDIAKQAVEHADALLNQLQATEGEG